MKKMPLDTFVLLTITARPIPGVVDTWTPRPKPAPAPLAMAALPAAPPTPARQTLLHALRTRPLFPRIAHGVHQTVSA